MELQQKASELPPGNDQTTLIEEILKLVEEIQRDEKVKNLDEQE